MYRGGFACSSQRAGQLWSSRVEGEYVLLREFGSNVQKAWVRMFGVVSFVKMGEVSDSGFFEEVIAEGVGYCEGDEGCQEGN